MKTSINLNTIRDLDDGTMNDDLLAFLEVNNLTFIQAHEPSELEEYNYFYDENSDEIILRLRNDYIIVKESAVQAFHNLKDD